MLEKDMLEAAETMEFEKAARLRDRIKELKELPEMTIDRNAKPGIDNSQPPTLIPGKGKSTRPRRTKL